MISSENNESSKAIRKAGEAIENANYNFNGGYYSVTANRTYYACYYCLIAILFTKNIQSKTHQGTRTKFSESFIKTGIFPVEFSYSITLLFDYRQEADYDIDENITREEAEMLIEKVNEIYNHCKNYLFETHSK